MSHPNSESTCTRLNSELIALDTAVADFKRSLRTYVTDYTKMDETAKYGAAARLCAARNEFINAFTAIHQTCNISAETRQEPMRFGELLIPKTLSTKLDLLKVLVSDNSVNVAESRQKSIKQILRAHSINTEGWMRRAIDKMQDSMGSQGHVALVSMAFAMGAMVPNTSVARLKEQQSKSTLPYPTGLLNIYGLLSKDAQAEVVNVASYMPDSVVDRIEADLKSNSVWDGSIS